MGRGVFANRSFQAGEIIEVCPVIPLTPREAGACSKTILDDYFFEWGPRGEAYALALGFGSLFNHSDDPNAEFRRRIRDLQIEFRALVPIAKGEQITIDYGWPDTKNMPPPVK
jgi:SET domain-containing protein